MKKFRSVLIAMAIVAMSSVCALASTGPGLAETIDKIIIPFGIVTYLLVATTAIIGFRIRKKPKVMMKWHKRVAIIAICVATCHGLFVALLEYHIFK